MRWLQFSLVIGSLLWFAVGAVVVITHTESKLMGGVTWQSAIICVWESFFCVGICLGLLVWSREHYNRQGGFERWMTGNCFSAYLFHTPLLVGITLAMQGLRAPAPVKFITATAAGTLAAFVASALVFRKIPLLRRVL
jgi:glucan biosynthesis protein C